MAERIIEGLLELRDGRGTLVIEQREVVVEDPPRLPASDAARDVEEEGGVVNLVAAEGAEDADQVVGRGDAVERRPVVGEEGERRVLGGHLRARVEPGLADVARRACGKLGERLAVGGRERVELRLPLGRRVEVTPRGDVHLEEGDRKSTRLNSSHLGISYAVFC